MMRQSCSQAICELNAAARENNRAVMQLLVEIKGLDIKDEFNQEGDYLHETRHS